MSVVAVKTKGEMRIPRRSADKGIFPLCLNISMGGHVEYYWLTPKARSERIASGEKVKDNLPKLVRIFYGDK